ncbi:MAG: hypothetical protein O7E51_04750 [Acidobacteria bacterium]|nr:hypothetical protein [Acidobacteriota bacterium]
MGNKHKITIGLFALAVAVLWNGAVSANAQQGGWSSPPPQLNLPAGSWISIRVNQPISSDHNLPGDYFIGSLAHPLVANGFVIAHRGQTVEGRIVVAQKAGRRSGTSSLGLELTEISLVDGTQMPVVTEWIEHAGPTSVGDDVVAIGTATGIGAAIGAAVDGGFGAGMGAIAGAAASTIGVLATRGKPTEVYPESTLTFRTLSPLTVETASSAAAFQPVRQEDYAPVALQRRGRTHRAVPGRRYYKSRPSIHFSYGYPYGYYGYPYGYYDPFPRYFYGPTVVIRPAPRIYRPHIHRPHTYRPRFISPRIVIGGGHARRGRGQIGRGRGQIRSGDPRRDSNRGRDSIRGPNSIRSRNSNRGPNSNRGRGRRP